MDNILRIVQAFESLKYDLQSIIDKVPETLSGTEFKVYSSFINDELQEIKNLRSYFGKGQPNNLNLLKEVTSKRFDRGLCTRLFLSIQSYILSLGKTSLRYQNKFEVFLDEEKYLKPESSQKFRSRIEKYEADYECSFEEAYNIAFEDYQNQKGSEEFLQSISIKRTSIIEEVKSYIVCHYWMFIDRFNSLGCFEDHKLLLKPVNEVLDFKIKEESELKRVFEKMIGEGFIDKTTSIRSFLNVFGGRGKIGKDVIVWADYQDNKKANKMSLLYFLDTILSLQVESNLKYSFIIDFFRAGIEDRDNMITKKELSNSRSRLNGVVKNQRPRLCLIESIIDV